MSKNEHTFYFVRYPIGAGGTHLLNLISLSENIDNKICSNASDYFLYLKYLYNNDSKNAHSKHQFIISNEDLSRVLPQTNYNLHGSVYSGHAASFFWASATLKTLKVKKYISITFNTDKSEQLLSAREYKLFGTNTFKNEYYKREMQHFYNQEFVSDCELCNDDVNLNFEVTDIFSKDITPVIEKINHKYNIGIHIDKAQELHNLWIKKI